MFLFIFNSGLHYAYTLNTGCSKKSIPLNMLWHFLSNGLAFHYEIIYIYWCITDKHNSVASRNLKQSKIYKLCSVTTLWFLHFKNVPNTPWNNVIQMTLENTNAYLPQWLGMFKVFTPAATQAFSHFWILFTALSISTWGRLFQIDWNSSVSLTVVFGFGWHL